MNKQNDVSFEQANIITIDDAIDEDYISYDELDKEIEKQLEIEFKDLEQLKCDRQSIGDPKKITNAISQIVWEQFILQVAGTAGSDFIKENHDLNLSLKKSSHYLQSDKFVNGEMPEHNFDNVKEYKENYEVWKTNFKDNDPTRGINRDVLDDPKRVHGNGSMSMDHTVSIKETITDPDMATFVSQKDKKEFANGPKNLKPMDSAANQSKGSKTMSDFLNSERDGKKPAERFNINEEECRENDKIAREEKQRLIDEGKKKANAEGRASRIDELKRSAQFTTQAVVVALLAKFTKTVFEEVIKWLMEKEHKSKELINHIRKAIHDFIYDFKNNVLLGIDVAITTILTQLFGKIIPMIKKALVFVSIGGKSVFEVSKYLKSPENANKDTYTKMMEVGEIFITGLTAASGVALGMGITYVLTKYAPPLAAFQIPLLGSAASLMGIFFGGLTAGICGAIIMAIIEGRLSGKMLNENSVAQFNKTEGILRLQNIQFENYENSVNVAASSAASNITSDFKETRNRLEEIRNKKNEPIESDNEEKFNDLSNLIAKLDV